MIVCSISDLPRYKGILPNLDTAIDWLIDGSHLKHKENGDIEVDGKKVFASYNTYIPKVHDEPDFESHINYVDIQMVISGEELVQVRDKEGMEVTVPYTPDIEFQKVPSDESYHTVLLQPGTALILFPEDSHRPSLRRGEDPGEVFKVVVKVHL